MRAIRFLEHNYDITYLKTVVHSAGKATSNVHDRAVGSIGVYHLFRLSKSLESELHRMPLAEANSFFLKSRNAMERQEKLINLLALIYSDEEL